MLQYGLFKNYLTTDPDDYVAIPQNVNTKTEEDILAEMVVPGGVTSTQAKAVFTARREAIEKLLKQGNAVQTYFTELKPAIKGVFNSDDESFSSGKHSVSISASTRKVLKNMGASIKVEKVLVNERAPIIMKFIDTATDRQNDIITPGMVGEIKGGYLKCDITDSKQGVFIILSNGSEIRCDKYIHNTSSKLLFYIPSALTANEEVSIEVRSCISNSVKEPRTGKFSYPLSVQAP